MDPTSSLSADPRLRAFLERQGAVVWVLRHRPPVRDLDDPLFQKLNDSDRIRARELPLGARRIEWAEGRRLAGEVREALGGPKENGRFSISHTAGIVMVLGVRWPHGDFAGVGLDVELLDRKVDDRVLERIAQPEERTLDGLRPLDFWVVKEASFKANPNNAGTVVAQYRITLFDSGTGEGVVNGPGGPTSFWIGELESRWRYAVAVVRQKKSV